MHARTILASMLALGAAGALAMTTAGLLEPEYTSDFNLEHCRRLHPDGTNPFFSLTPGRVLRLEGEDDGEFAEVEISVLRQTRRVPFRIGGERTVAITRVVEEREWIDGELVEVSRNYFAECDRTGNIYYFGEEVDIYENGEIVSHDGAWLAGQDGAMPGLIMPGLPLLGSRYYQEVAPGIALDRADHVREGLDFQTPAGLFHDCIKIVETSPLEPDSVSIKVYAPGVGLIYDDGIELVEYHD